MASFESAHHQWNQLPTTFLCGVCHEVFQVDDEVAIRLPCSHVYCYNCFEQFRETRCPMCRKSHSRPIFVKQCVDAINLLQAHISEPVQVSLRMPPPVTTFDLDDYLDVTNSPPQRRTRRRRRRDRGRNHNDVEMIM